MSAAQISTAPALTFDPADPVALTQALVRCPSVTPEEGGALALLATLLAAEGYDVHRPVFSEPNTPDVENLYARIGSTAPVFVIAGHTDVVPVGDAAAWTREPFGGAISFILMTATMFTTQLQLMRKNMPKAALEGQAAQMQKVMLYVFPIMWPNAALTSMRHGLRSGQISGACLG